MNRIIFEFLSKQFFFSTIIFIAIGLAALVLRKKHPIVLYALWTLFFLRLLMPPNVNHEWTLRSGIDYLVSYFTQHNEQMVDFTHHSVNIDAPEASALPVQSYPPDWQNYLILIWGIGVALGLLIFLGKRAYFYRLARKGKPVNIEIYKLLKIWQNRFGFRRKVIIRMSDKIPTAFTMGVFNTVIVLPENMPDDTEAMIAHELAHIQRFDDFWIVLQNLISIFYFFHPAVWLASRQIYIARECICDSMVLSHRKIDRSAYGQSLINSLKFAFWNAAGVGTLSFGSTKSAMKIRINNVKETRMLKNKIWIITLFILTAVFILPLAGFVASETEDVKPTPVMTKAINFQRPLAKEFRLTSQYGMRTHPITKKEQMHIGTDWGAPKGTTVKAVADGMITKTKTEYTPGKGYGMYMEVQHANGFMSRYAQLSAIDVKEGQSVKSGEKIAEVGSSGTSTAPHLHFELWKDGEHVNPQDYITK